MTRIWQRIREELGLLGVLALFLLALGAGVWQFIVRPMEERHRLLEERVREAARNTQGKDTKRNARTPQAKLAAFYASFDRPSEPIDDLAALRGIARGAGLDFRAAEYRSISSEGKIERYQIQVPFAGSYAQIQSFLDEALNEIPILSLDQITLRRSRVNQAQIEADLVLTLHWLRR